MLAPPPSQTKFTGPLVTLTLTQNTAPPIQPTQTQQSTNQKLEEITLLLSEATLESADAISACQDYLGYNLFSEHSQLTTSEYKEKETDLLELALEFYSNKNKIAPGIISRAISGCYRGSCPNAEVEFHSTPKFQSHAMFNKNLQKAAESGRKVAQFVLGTMYTDGKEKDIKRARFYLQQSADQGYQPAIDALHSLPMSAYMSAQKCEESDLSKAFLLYKQAAAEGDVEAMFRLGELYLNAKDESNALKYFKQAFINKHKDACFYLAEIFVSQYKKCTFKFMNSTLLGDALKYYELTIQKGGINVAAATFKYLDLKADSGDINAQCQLGELYITGISSPHPDKNVDSAEKYLKLAADKGHGRAAYILHDAYASSNFNCSNPAELALHYRNVAIKKGYLPAVLEKNAESGDRDAAKMISNFHLTGNKSFSLPPNKEKADKYLLLAQTKKEKVELKTKTVATTNTVATEKKPDLPYFADKDNEGL